MITGYIPRIKQAKEMDCWIAVAAMLVSWRENKQYTVENLIERMGNPWKLYFETNSGLPAEDQTAFIKELGLHMEPAANYTIEAYINFLNSYGPLWITTGDGLSAHARILIGLKGTGDYGSTQFILIDPSHGKEITQESLVFLKEFEEEARIANEEGWKYLRIQIYHF